MVLSSLRCIFRSDTNLARIAFNAFTTVVFLAFMTSCSSADSQDLHYDFIPDSFSAAGTEPVQQVWWNSLPDPELHELIDRALSGNFDLKMAWDRLDQARATAGIAGAQLWPSLSGQAGADRIFTDGGQAANNFSLGLVASYELDLWGRVRSSRSAAGFDYLSVTENLATAALSLSAQVAVTWYQLVYAYGRIDLIREQLDANRKVLDLIEWRYKKGKVGATDVLQQKQLIEQGIGKLEQALTSAATLESGLAILLGRSPNETVNVRRSKLPELPPLPKTDLPLDVIKRRPDIRSSFFAVKAADNRISAAIANRFPKISISAGASTGALETQDLFNNWLVTLSANLLAPFFEGGARAEEVNRTEAVAFEAFHGFCAKTLAAIGEIENALMLETRLNNYLNSLIKQYELSKQTLESAQRGYLNGTGDYLLVLDTLSRYQDIQLATLGARYDLIENRITLYRALAGGWPLERGAKGTYEDLLKFEEGAQE